MTDSTLSAESGLNSHLEGLLWGDFSFSPSSFGKFAARNLSQSLCGACVLSDVQLFCDPLDGSPPGSSVHGILQARILEGVVISSSRASNLHLLHWQVDSLVPYKMLLLLPPRPQK